MHDDNDLMEKVKDGDKDAYEVLVLKHRVSAINFANSFLMDIHTAEDIVQECFAKVYINRMEYKPSFTFKTYLFTIIRNKCIDHLRKLKRNAVLNLDEIGDIKHSETPEVLLSQRENMNKIFQNIKSLNDDYRTAIYLFAIEEMSYEKIAKVMQKSVFQVKVTLHRARKKLKSYMVKGDDIFEK